ncbi:cysteine-rich RLK (RECEPTOR-like protein kinase) 42 [Actinidia rufa]|uniref:Cysteine-rich RLK (RECEPTOR-like protein kinase) 42 n=1 Tax=Actinidia rufa TaxID=165716 RepID=A0A7J0HCK5_9ERIC|nr:cysteine-rich RLK (RECEPTOR-like protein kinase) 42 [Actinidia rufa]
MKGVSVFQSSSATAALAHTGVSIACVATHIYCVIDLGPSNQEVVSVEAYVEEDAAGNGGEAVREARAGHDVAEEAVGVGEVAVALGQTEDGSDGGVDGEVAPMVGCDEEGKVFHFLDEGWDVVEVTRRWGGAAEEGHL